MKAEQSVAIRNIFYMLAYAYQALELNEFAEVGAEEFDNALDLLGAVYAKGLASQVRRGLDQNFLERSDDIGCARGRIDALVSSNTTHRQRAVLRCTFSEMSHDTELNRLIKCTGFMFLRSPELKKETKSAIRRLLPYLSEVALVEPSQARRIKPVYTRSNRSYKLLVAVCEFAMRGLLPNESEVGAGFAKVLDSQELSHLYEKFLLAYYRRHHSSRVDAAARQIPWAAEGSLPSFLPGMHTDVTLKGKGERMGRTLIIDAKCYGRILTGYHGKQMISPGNVYQIYTYVKNADIAHNGSVSGLLLYALTDEGDLPFDAKRNSWELEGNKFEVRTLDLNRPFKEIATQLDDVLNML